MVMMLPNTCVSRLWFFCSIIIDDISMVSTTNFAHVVRTLSELSVRPLLVVAGDVCQMKPIATENDNIVQVECLKFALGL